jgi:sugar phosphate isomerase/epimerase
MNLIASTAPFFLRPVREAFRGISDAGFTGAEVMVTHDENTQGAGKLARAASEFGLAVEAIHTPSLLLTRRVWGKDPIGKVTRAVEMASDVGASVVVAHPPYRWQHGYRAWLEYEMPSLAKRAGVTVAMENMFPVRAGRLKGPGLHDRDLGGYANTTLDTSHAAVAGRHPIEAAAEAGERLSHVHLSNNSGKGWDSHLPVYEGVLPIAGLLDHLAHSGYRGAVSLELDLRRWMDDPAALRDVLRRNREFCAAAVEANLVSC